MIQKRRIFYTVLISGLASLLNKGFPIVILFFVLRRIGVEEFGEAQFGITLMEISLPFIIFGYNLYGTILVGRSKADPGKVGEIITDVLLCKLLHAVVAFLVILSFLYLSPRHQKYIPEVLALSFYLFFSAIELSWVQMGIQKISVFSIMEVVAKLPATVAILVFVQSQEDALLYAVFMLAGNALAGLMTTIYALRIYRPAPISFARAKPMFRRSIGFAIGLVIAGSLERLDVLFSEFFGGAMGIGIYSGQARLIHSINQLFVIVGTTFFSEIVSVKESESHRKHLDLGVWVILSLFFAVVGGAYFVGPELVTAILGSEYMDADPVFQILAVGLLPNALIFVYGWQVLYYREETKKVTISMIVAGISVVLLCVALQSVWGMSGIAWGAVLGKGLGAVVLMVFGFKYFPIALRTVGKAALPAIGMCFVLWFCGDLNFVVKIFVGAMAVVLFHAIVNFRNVQHFYARLRMREMS